MSESRETIGGVGLHRFGALVLLRFDAGWTTSDLSKVMERILEIAPHRFAVVSVLRKTKPAGAIERKAISERLSAIEGEVNERIVVSAVVTDSMLARGAFRAVRWLNPARYPVLTFEHLGSALEECFARIARDGIAVSADDVREARIFAARGEHDRDTYAREM